MKTLRRAGERGRTRLEWLDSHHTFSFNAYYDPRWTGFRDLVVLNDDVVAPGGGFGTHGHRDMEIISYVLDGALEHRDSSGGGSTLRPGEVQRMSAGTGIRHSEVNPSREEAVHFLQVWIRPERPGLPPSYEQKVFPADERTGRWCLVAAPNGRGGALAIHQDVEVLVTLLDPGQPVRHALRSDRHAWLQVARGRITLDGITLETGDGVAVSDEKELAVTAQQPAELLLFDLA